MDSESVEKLKLKSESWGKSCTDLFSPSLDSICRVVGGTLAYTIGFIYESVAVKGREKFIFFHVCLFC